MGARTDVARESADVLLIGNDLMKFAETELRDGIGLDFQFDGRICFSSTA